MSRRATAASTLTTPKRSAAAAAKKIGNERDDARDGEKRRVDPGSNMLVRPLLQDRLRRHEHECVANAEDGGKSARHSNLEHLWHRPGSEQPSQDLTAEGKEEQRESTHDDGPVDERITAETAR